jgi:hypothetical protein
MLANPPLEPTLHYGVRMDVQSLLSDLKLGVRAVVLLPLQRAFRGTRGLEHFQASFFPERLLPTSLEDRQRLREASLCVGCGACDVAVASAHGDDAGPRPSLLPTVYARSVVELPYALDDVRKLASRAGVLRAAERACPTGVPLEKLAHWLARRGQGER